ncbi:hypothetical protein GQQ13_18845 [Pantoea agglomerans]|uniref:right-handed parallel beta-helix repeat-containing protein n=1 Tax=Enterobacter agglomerans TaxID=549 RepID=UPI0013C279F3|nr:right-handed parallel beta-helix repeat-containing protein [Pantoea agglomerans]NEH20509.1 hypothetical protein [Pantoea agglomerans]
MKKHMHFARFFAAFALIACAVQARASVSLVCSANQNLQGCVESAARAGGGIVHLTPQTYLLEKTLELSSNVALEGAGPQSVITWNPSVASRINAPLLHATAVTNVAIKDVKVVGTIDQRPESQDLRNDQIGLFFDCSGDPTVGEKTSCSDITLQNVEVEDSSHGIHIKGAEHVTATDLKLHNNGNTLKDYFHNIYLRRVADVRLIQTSKNSGGIYASPRGHGIRGSHMINVYMSNLEVYDNADYGIHMDTVTNVRFNNLHVFHNCLSGKAGCVQIKCFGPTCDVHPDVPAEQAVDHSKTD